MLLVQEAPANRATKVGTPILNTIGMVADQAFSDIALVSKVELYCICKRERVQAFLIE